MRMHEVYMYEKNSDGRTKTQGEVRFVSRDFCVLFIFFDSYMKAHFSYPILTSSDLYGTGKHFAEVPSVKETMKLILNQSIPSWMNVI